MHSLRELIYPTYFLQLISIIAQKSQIPRECRAVAAYVDDTFWLHLEDGLEQHFIAAFAWRVDYDHVCVDTVFLVFSRQTMINSGLSGCKKSLSQPVIT